MIPGTPPDPLTDPPNVPDYTLIRIIGEGSYGQVWLARSATGTLRAIKIVRRIPDEDGRDFARAFRGLKHYEPISRQDESLMDVLHVGPAVPESYFYCVMELADAADALRRNDAEGMPTEFTPGQIEANLWNPPEPSPLDPATYVPLTLRLHLSRKGRLPAGDCVDLGIALCRALGALHRHGLVHRDIKPSNIIFARGMPKLADIDLVTPPDSTLRRKVAEGYTPPEGAGSVRADIYSLGKVLYAISTGLDRTDFPTPPEHLPEADVAVWADLNEVVIRACKPVPTERYASAREMHDELLLVRAGRPIRRLRLLERQRRNLLRAMAIVVGLTLLASIALVRERHLVGQIRLAEADRRQSLIDLHMANGRRALDDGLPHQAILWFTRALDLADEPANVRQLRDRIGAIRGLSPKLVSLGFHRDLINEVAFHPSGTLFVTASDDGTAQVWNAETGRQAGDPMKHDAAINHVGFSPDGTRIVTGGADGAVKLWNTDSQRQELRTLIHGTNVFVAAFSPDGLRIASAGTLGAVKVWDTDSGKCLFTLSFHTDDIEWVEFSPDGRWLATASGDSQAGVWNALDGTARYPPWRHPDVVEFVAFSPDGARLLTACRDGVVRFFDARSGKPERLELRHERLNHAAFSHDGTMVVTCTGGSGQASEVRVWNAQSGQPIGPALRHNNRVRYAEFSHDDRWLATAGHDAVVQLVRVGKSDPPVKLSLGDRTWALAFSPDGKRLLTAGRETCWRMWAVDAFDTQSLPNPPFWGVFHAEFSRDANWLYASSFVAERLWQRRTNGLQLVRQSRHPVSQAILATDRFNAAGTRFLHHRDDHRLMVLNLPTLEPAGTALPADPSICSASLSLDGATVYTGDRRGQVIAWDVRSGSPIGKPVVAPSALTTLLRNHAGDNLFLGSENPQDLRFGSTFLRLDVAERQPSGTRWQPERRFNEAVFSGDDQFLALCLRDKEGPRIPGRVFFLDPATNEDVFPGLDHPDQVICLALHPNGKVLATGSSDGFVRTWQIPDGQPVGPSLRHEAGVRSVAFLPDGERLLSGGTEGSARLWNYRNGESLTPPITHDSSVAAAKLFRNGTGILTTAINGEVRIYDIAPATESVSALVDRAELESGTTLTRDGRLLVLTPEQLRERWFRSAGIEMTPKHLRFQR